jgi:hypothetical protein
MMPIMTHCSNKLAVQRNGIYRKRISTITMITNPKIQSIIRGSIIMMVMIRGIKESRTWKRVLTSRNLKRRRRILSLSMWTKAKS